MQYDIFVVNNSLLIANRELSGTIEMLFGSTLSDVVSGLSYLTTCVEKVLFKIDETIHEARQARESMLLYIQVPVSNSIAYLMSRFFSNNLFS